MQSMVLAVAEEAAAQERCGKAFAQSARSSSSSFMPNPSAPGIPKSYRPGRTADTLNHCIKAMKWDVLGFS